jgi:hypothetical protein
MLIDYCSASRSNDVQVVLESVECSCIDEGEEWTMKLRRHVAAIAWSLAMLVGLAGPVMAAPNIPVPVSLTITEGGSFSYWLWGSSGVNIGSMVVSTSSGGTTASINQRMDMTDSRASSPGWTLSIAASNFSDGHGHLIENSNIRMLSAPFTSYPDCMVGGGDPLPSTMPVNNTNPFQVVTGSTSLPSSMSSSLALVTATSGRGCGVMGLSLQYTVTVPPGTYTGGGTTAATGTVYTSTLSLTESAAPGA